MGEDQKFLVLKSETRQGCWFLWLLFDILQGILARAFKQEKELKGSQIGRKELPLLANANMLTNCRECQRIYAYIQYTHINSQTIKANKLRSLEGTIKINCDSIHKQWTIQRMKLRKFLFKEVPKRITRNKFYHWEERFIHWKLQNVPGRNKYMKNIFGVH